MTTEQRQSGLAILGAILAIVVAIAAMLVLAWLIFWWFPIAPFRHAISDVFDGARDPSDATRFEWDCRWDCGDLDWLRDLPPLTRIHCVQFLKDHGACCYAIFERGIRAEMHVFRLGEGRYRMSFYSYPMCDNPDYARALEAGNPHPPQWVRCDERWRKGDRSIFLEK